MGKRCVRVERDRGQAAILLVVVVAVLTVVFVGAVAEFGGHVVDRTRAQTVADAAALASLEGGRSAAVEIAGRNGGEVVRWWSGPGAHEVTVVVRVGDVTAVARASDAP